MSVDTITLLSIGKRDASCPHSTAVSDCRNLLARNELGAGARANVYCVVCSTRDIRLKAFAWP
eukprot:1772209-Pleurochrysis_carterae.AAC.4